MGRGVATGRVVAMGDVVTPGGDWTGGAGRVRVVRAVRTGRGAGATVGVAADAEGDGAGGGASFDGSGGTGASAVRAVSTARMSDEGSVGGVVSGAGEGEGVRAALTVAVGAGSLGGLREKKRATAQRATAMALTRPRVLARLPVKVRAHVERFAVSATTKCGPRARAEGAGREGDWAPTIRAMRCGLGLVGAKTPRAAASSATF